MRLDKTDKHTSRPLATPASTFPKVIKINAADNLHSILKRTLGPYRRYNSTCTGLSECSGNRVVSRAAAFEGKGEENVGRRNVARSHATAPRAPGW